MTNRIVVISDTHNQHEKLVLPEGDILIHCGDFSGTGNYSDHFKFSKWMGEQNFKYKICTPGNHDRYSAEKLNISKDLFETHGVELLVDELSKQDHGLKIYGSPWTPRYGRWYWMRDRGRHIGVKWDNIPEKLDILITHGPPFGILDISVYDKINVGCEELLKEVLIKQPKHHVFGHIHHFGGQKHRTRWTDHHNAAICNEEYKPENKIVEFDI